MINTLFLIEDHQLYAEALAGAIFANYQEPNKLTIHTTACVEWAISKMRACKDKRVGVILDLELPGLSGLEALRKIQETRIPSMLIILSAESNKTDVDRYLLEEIDAFISKNVRSEILIDSLIQSMTTNEKKKRASWIKLGEANNVKSGSFPKEIKLTPRQKQILAFMKKGYSNKEIGNLLKLTESTVKKHISTILLLLNAKNRTEAVDIARTTQFSGYLLE